MIGETVPDRHKQAIAQLSAQIDHYLSTGHRIQPVPSGATGLAGVASSSHHDRLRANRDLKAPMVRELAAQGLDVLAIAKACGVDSRMIKRIIAENEIPVATS